MDSPQDKQRFEWERVERCIVAKSPQRDRYPSIVSNTDGVLLVLFTQQTPQQDRAGLGDLVLVSSTDEGKNWSKAEVVYRGEHGEPRAVGTMSVKKNGRIESSRSDMSAGVYRWVPR